MKSLILLFIFAVSRIGQSEDSKLQVSMYYESKCPDSRRFIEDQLMPTINLLEDDIQLNMIPFGKARSLVTRDNEYTFECQHGPPECMGNVMQDCALHHMQGWPNTNRVAYVLCEMTTLSGTTGDFMCVKKAGLPVDHIHECMHSEEGLQLQLISESLTNSVNHDFIPTITLNGIYDQKIQDESMEDFMGVVCSVLKNNEQCANRYNN